MPSYIITNMRTIGIKNKSKIYIWGALALMLVVIACDYQKMNEKSNDISAKDADKQKKKI
jgi:hypothetical protein